MHKERKSQPAVQTHASLDGILAQRSSLVGDQVGSTREHTLGRNTGCGNGKVVPCDARQTRIAPALLLPPLQDICVDCRSVDSARQVSLQLALLLHTASLQCLGPLVLPAPGNLHAAGLVGLWNRCRLWSSAAPYASMARSRASLACAICSGSHPLGLVVVRLEPWIEDHRDCVHAGPGV